MDFFLSPMIPNFLIFDVKKDVLIDLKLDGPNVVKSEGLFFLMDSLRHLVVNIGKSDMFSGLTGPDFSNQTVFNRGWIV